MYQNFLRRTVCLLAAPMFLKAPMGAQIKLRKLMKLPSSTAISLVGKTDTSKVLEFIATAYSIRDYTSCGVRALPGVVAADPAVLPMGSIIRLSAGEYSGVYQVLDTGPSIRGKRLDIFVGSRNEAIRFGRRRVQVEILRCGWKGFWEI
ncbi:MAG: 3D domain-containing protein [Acidobacteriota bacterium]|nr:3D domain-containing protein [Blastocatellia bacterium]MDW8411199.1 3D domain-containing protein [Acidobacteriota bacterium]